MSVNVNDLLSDVGADVHAAAVVFPSPGRLYVAVDSRRAGRYVLRSWVNDVTPPALRLLTTRVTAGNPVLVARATDAQSGVDPLALELDVGGRVAYASQYDPDTGLALFPVPVDTGTHRVRVVASDLQEAKNVETIGPAVLPNTRSLRESVDAVPGPTVTWLEPTTCVRTATRLLAAGSAPVRFYDGSHVLGTGVKRHGIYALWWTPKAKGTHTLRAVVGAASATRVVRAGCH